MKIMRRWLTGGLLLLLSSPVFASGPMGIVAVIERVEFEPDAQAPERVLIYGAFAWYDGQHGSPTGFSSPAKGYMYFTTSPGVDNAATLREWADLASVAGTGEAVAFGTWGYIGQFSDIRIESGVSGPQNAYVLSNRAQTSDFGVRPAAETPVKPVPYQPGDLGIVRMGNGNHDEMIERLQATLAE
jgi:hypothetical protein